MNRRTFSWAPWAGALLLTFPMTLDTAAQVTTVGACDAEVAPALRELGVPEDDVQSVQVTRRNGAPNPQTNYVYDAWVRLDACDTGYLVITLTRYCHVQQSYTRGDCQVSGVPGY